MGGAAPEENGPFWSRALRSGLRRYPAQLASSLRRPTLDELRESTFAARWEANRDRHVVSWLGHCSVLLRLGGLTILTDPVFSRRIGVRVAGFTVGVERLSDTPVRVPHLPNIDLILLSHAHFDHLDKPTLRELAAGAWRGATVVTARRVRGLVPRGFAAVEELHWGERLTVPGPGGGVEVEAMRPAHWGARAAWDRFRGFNSYGLRTADARVLFAGDTAFTDGFNGFGPADLAIFGIGAYDPWVHAHATPEQVWEMFTALRGAKLLPVHHSTFQLGDEAPAEPMERLLRAVGDQHARVLQAVPGEVVVWRDDGASP